MKEIILIFFTRRSKFETQLNRDNR